MNLEGETRIPKVPTPSGNQFQNARWNVEVPSFVAPQIPDRVDLEHPNSSKCPNDNHIGVRRRYIQYQARYSTMTWQA